MSFMGDLSHLPPLSSDEMAKKENDMNRRDFLKSLVAIGVSIALPGQTLASASDELIDQAWHKVIKDPITFYVNEWGCLSTSPVEYFPDTRLELFDLDLVSDKGSLIELSKEKWRVQDIVDQHRVDQVPPYATGAAGRQAGHDRQHGYRGNQRKQQGKQDQR